MTALLERYVRPEESEPLGRQIVCFCCRDTGVIVLSHELRDEHPCDPPMACQRCDALRGALIKAKKRVDGEDKYLTPEELRARLDCYDQRALRADCDRLHLEAREDAQTIGLMPGKLREMFQGVGKPMPPSMPDPPPYNEQQLDEELSLEF